MKIHKFRNLTKINNKKENYKYLKQKVFKTAEK